MKLNIINFLHKQAIRIYEDEGSKLYKLKKKNRFAHNLHNRKKSKSFILLDSSLV